MPFLIHLSPQSTQLPERPGARLSSALNRQTTSCASRWGDRQGYSSCTGYVVCLLTLLLLVSGHTMQAHTHGLIYTTPGSTTQPVGTQLSINKLVDKTTAKIGDVLSYTLVIANDGSATATNVVARDSSTTGLRYVPGSVSVPAGSSFSSGAPVSTWTVPSISAGQSFSLTFQAIADSSGILYTKATIPGDTATVCTSVPVKVCTGDTYLFRLTAAPGRSSYKWFRNGVELTTQTTNVLDVTAAGTYNLAVDNVSGLCPDFSCCPFVVEEDTLPTFRAIATPVTCVDGVTQTNGRITLTNYNPAYTYQYSAGTDFNEAAPLSGSAKPIPSGGVIVDNVGNLSSAQPYTIRVFNTSGCYTDVTVTMQPSGCCSLSAVVTAATCQPATNTYSATAVVTLTNSTTGILTVTNGPQSTTFATNTTPTASFTAVFTDLVSDSLSHTVTVSLPGCSTATTTYTAPASCSAVPTPTLALSVTPGDCQIATNEYTISGTLSLTNAIAGTATLTDGSSTTSLSVSAGASSVPYSITGLISGTGSRTVTVSYATQTISQTYTAPVSCSVAVAVTPVCSVSAVAKAIPATCRDNVIQANGQIILSAFNPAHTYQYSAGASFDPKVSLSGLAKAIPSDGLLVDTLANPAANQSYTVRVYSNADCYTDVTVVLTPTVCVCIPDICVPFVIQQTKRAERIGDAR